MRQLTTKPHKLRRFIRSAVAVLCAGIVVFTASPATVLAADIPCGPDIPLNQCPCPSDMDPLDCKAIIGTWTAWKPDDGVCTPGANSSATASDNDIAQHMFVGVDNPVLAKQIMLKYDIGGLFLVSSGSPGRVSESLRSTLSGLQSSAKTPLFIATDQEYTSTVNSFGLADGKKASDLAGNTGFAQSEGERFGTALSAAGVNMDFAPTVDIQVGSNAIIGVNNRGISSDPQTITDAARAFSAGLTSKGVMATIKHFPGHGNSSGDSHQTLPTTPALAQLEASDLKPFKDLANEPKTAVMVGHLDVPGLTNGKPASASTDAYKYLREKTGFKGLAITDELANMAGAGSASLGTRISDSLNAGADMALFNVSSLEAFENAFNEAKPKIQNGDAAAIKNQKRALGLNIPDSNVSIVSGTTAGGTSCCTASNGAGLSITLAGNNNTEKILSFLMSNQGYKFNLVQAAGLVGNFFVESGGTNIDGSIPDSSMEVGPNPAAVSGAGFYGIAQWGLGRWQGPNSLNAFAEAHGGKWDDLDMQLRFLVWELGVGETWEGHSPTEVGSMEAVRPYENSSSAEDAGKVAYEFEKLYERCGCTQEKRANAGRHVFSYYADKAALPGSSSTSSTTNPVSTSAACTKSSGVASGDFVFYNQWDPNSPWAGMPYGGGTYGNSGCGPTAAAMVIATWKDKSVTPLQTGEYTLSIGGQFQGSRQPEVLEHFGVHSDYIGTGNKFDEVVAALKEGKMAIVSASGTNPFTSVGHFIVIRGITPDGQLLLGDPNAGVPGSGMKREENNTRPWSLEEFRAAAPGGFNSVNIITKPGQV